MKKVLLMSIVAMGILTGCGTSDSDMYEEEDTDTFKDAVEQLDTELDQEEQFGDEYSDTH
ncbi:hypothetical protein [Peribacillus frigoritolerans]|uniref:Secreted protein n=1 Tax=Peribacillus castrilensis TaxID=2897690 RepID=A0AAW9NP45_9BACI|nr:hypothetical protein [Peribacillus castrilensis]